MPRPHVIFLGGFLGAGKTSAVGALARYLTEQGIRIGIITNDQGSGLVDSELARACGHRTEEIVGGCFCCRFDDLLDASSRLIDGLSPDAIIAEAVGSCTDLVATVTYPLRRLHGDSYTVGPLSVLVDPLRALAMLGIEGRSALSPAVEYIYRRQIEEADVLVTNKCDLMSTLQLQALNAALALAAPSAERFSVSVRTGEGLEAWFRRITFGEQRPRPTMNVDYDAYADGESRLGWLNATLQIVANPAVDATVLLHAMAHDVAGALRAAGAPIAHLKMTLHPSGKSDVASIHLVRDDLAPELGVSLDEAVSKGRIICNLRAEADPDTLSHALATAIGNTQATHAGLRLTEEHREAFRPGRPIPTHRDAAR